MKCLWPIVFSLVLFSCVSSQRTIFLKAPPADKRDSVDVTAYEARYGKYDGVYLDMDESIEHSGTSEKGGFGTTSWDYHYVERRKYLVLNPDAEYLTTFSLGTYQSATIGTLYLRVTSPNGTVSNYGIKDLVKETPSKNTVKYKFIYPNIVKGTIIEEGFELSYDAFRSRAPIQHEIPLQYNIPCEKISFTYAYPDWWDIRVKNIGRNDTIPYTSRSDPGHHKKIMSYSALNVPAVKNEPYDPYFKEMAKYLEFMVSTFDMGPVRYTSAKDWSELVSRHRKSLTDREGSSLFSSRVEKTTGELTRSKQGKLEKLIAILDYVQSNIEIATDNEDRDFADVLKDKKGDGYEMTGLTNMMMKKAGLESDFVMVHSAKEGYFDPNYYSFDQLSIPAVDLKVDGKEYVLLPYRKDIPYDHIPEYLQGQMSIIVSEAEHATLGTIPSGSQTKNSVSERFDLVIGEDGMIKVDEAKTIQGSYAYFLREYLADIKQTERDKFLKELISYSEGQVNIASFALDNEKEHKKPLVLRYSYTIDNLITLTPDEVLFHTAGLFAPTSLKAFRVESEERNNPIKVYDDDEYVKEIVVHYPATWEMKAIPEPVTIENAFGSLKMQAVNSGHSLNVTQRRFLHRNSAPKENIAELAKLTGSKTSTALPTVMFKRKQ